MKTEAMPATRLTAQLASLGHDLSPDRLPEDVTTLARHSLLDWFSVLVAGWQDASIQALLAQARERGARPRATLFGSGERFDPQDAALINGTASHLLDFDDAHLTSRVHASIVLWPAVLAAAEIQGASGRDALAAFVAGLEVQARIAALAGPEHYRRGWHSTATLGSFGAAVAAGKLLRLDASQLRHALGGTATLTGGIRAVFGTPFKPLHAGRAASNGLLAADLVQRGFTAVDDIFDRPDGYLPLVANPVGHALTEPVNHWATRSLMFKYHASCYGTQAPADAATALRQALGGQVPGEGQLQVAVETQYLSVCNLPEPRTAMEARFSIRHLVALALAGWNTADERSFSAVAFEDPLLQQLRRRIEVVDDPALPRAHARIHFAGRDREPLVFRVDASQPETDLQQQRQKLLNKSRQLLAGWIPAGSVAEVQDLLLGLDRFDDIRDWLAQLRTSLGAAWIQ